MVVRWETFRRNVRLAAFGGLVILAFTIAGCGSGEPASLEEQARSIDSSLICPVCPGETIDQAQVELASQMRALVRDKLAEGWSTGQITQYFVDLYGEGVLAAPPKEGINLVAWVVPFAVVGAAAILLLFVIRAMRKREDGSPLEERELEPYLPLVDRELGISQEGPKASDSQG